MSRLSQRALRAGMANVSMERHVLGPIQSVGWQKEGKQAAGTQRLEDQVAVEEPLEIRLAGDTLAITMRTPGSDRELVAGFLLSEGIIRSVAELGSIAHCGRPAEKQNVVDVLPAPGGTFDWEPDSPVRQSPISSACGICGRTRIDDLLRRVEPVRDASRFSAHWIASLTRRLGDHQANFQATGGVHAAAFWGAGGSASPTVVREDIGRHNAVDKVVGHLALGDRLPCSGGVLVVSGRVGFEIAQKAIVAQIPVLVSVSAPTSLSIAVARQSGLTLISFARDGRFNVYSGSERIEGAPPNVSLLARGGSES